MVSTSEMPVTETNGIGPRARAVEEVRDRMVRGALFLVLVGMPTAVLHATSDPTAIKVALARIVLCGAMSVWLMGGIWAGRFSVRRSPLNVPVSLYFLACAISVAFSGYRYASMDRLITVGICCSAFFLGLNFLRDRRGIGRAVYVLVGVGCLISAYGILQYFGIVLNPREIEGFLTVEYLPRAFSTLGHPNLFGGFLVFVLPVSFGLLLEEKSTRRRIALAAAMAVMGLALLYTRSRGAWLGAAVALIVFLVALVGSAAGVRIRWNWRKICIAAIVPVVSGALLWTVVPDSFVRRARATEDIGPRWIIWKAAARMFREHPIVGQGIGTFQIHYPQFRPNDYWLGGLDPNVSHAHNEYLEILAEMGGIGLVTFAGVVFAFFMAMSSGLRRANRGLAVGLCASVAGTLVHNGVSVSLRWISTGALFWLVLGIGGALAAASRPGEGQDDHFASFSLPPGFRVLPSAVIAIALLLFASAEVKAVLSQRYLLSGRRSLSEGDVDRATGELGRALELDRHNLSAYYKLGAAQVDEGAYQAGLDTFRKLVALAPEYAEVHHNMGAVLVRMGDLDAAVTEYERALHVHDTAGNRYDLAVLYEMKELSTEALRHYERFLVLAERSLQIHGDRQARSARYGRWEDATREALTLEETKRKMCRTYDKLMAYHAKTETWQSVASTIDRALEQCGGTARRFYTKGYALEQLGRIEDAVVAYREALEIDSTHAGSMNNLAFLYAEQDEHLDEALSMIRRAIELDPQNRLDYLDSLGWIHCRRGEYREAIRVLKDAMEKTAGARPQDIPLLAEMSYHLGMAYYGAGQRSSALRALRRTVRLSSEGEIAVKAGRVLDEMAGGSRKQEAGGRK